VAEWASVIWVVLGYASHGFLLWAEHGVFAFEIKLALIVLIGGSVLRMALDELARCRRRRGIWR